MIDADVSNAIFFSFSFLDVDEVESDDPKGDLWSRLLYPESRVNNFRVVSGRLLCIFILRPMKYSFSISLSAWEFSGCLRA